MTNGRYTFEIAPQFVDFQHKIKLASLVDLIMSAAGYNADANGFGLRHLNELGGSWVISRFSLEMKYFPKQYEKIEIETWIEEVHTLNTIRDFLVYNMQGEVIGKATSVWVMINLKNRRPMELSLLHGINDFINSKGDTAIRTLKLDEAVGEPIDKFKIKYSDIDINRHVNTLNYITWMVNCFSPDEHTSNIIKRFDVNFMNEILYNDSVEVFKEQLNANEYRFEIKSNSSTACRGKITFESI